MCRYTHLFRAAARAAFALTMAAVAMACGHVDEVSKGLTERETSREISSKEPTGDVPVAYYQISGDQLRVRVTHVHMCDVTTIVRSEKVETFERSASSGWWLWPAVGATGVGLGALMFALAPGEPTSGVDNEGRPSNPQQTVCIGGVVLTGLGTLTVLALTPFPFPSTSEKTQTLAPKTNVENHICGEDPYGGQLTLLHGAQAKTVTAGADGVAAVSLAALGSVDAPLVIVMTRSGEVLGEIPRPEEWKSPHVDHLPTQ